MNYRFVKTETSLPMLIGYANDMTGIPDDFVEEHMLKADFYQIIIGESACGFFTVYEMDKITSFSLEQRYYPYSQTIFKAALQTHGVKTAFVLTCDELFLSLCLDYQTKVELQAYMFDGTLTQHVAPPRYPRNCLFEVQRGELARMRELTGDFFDDFTNDTFGTGLYFLYRLEDCGTILGYGVIVPNKLKKGYWACGMITIEAHRQKGAGRSIQIHLGDICRENGAIPISGCWYHNHLSKKTIESVGRYSKTRLLHVYLRHER